MGNLTLSGRCICCAAMLTAAAIAAPSKVGIFDTAADVGDARGGKAEFDSARQVYRVTGGGANIWGTADAFQFAWKRLSGDVTFTADVQFIGAGAVAHRKAALMIRQGLEPDAAYADVALHGDGLTSLQYRSRAGAVTGEVRSPLNGPVRIRIERRGGEITMYAGKPGEQLQRTGPVTLALQDPVYVGLGVCSHDANVLETAVFSNVRLEAAPRTQSRTARPRITGVAHIALFVHDIEKSRAFYKDFLGFDEPFGLKKPDGSLSLTFIKINDRQYLELFPETAPGTDRLHHIALETDNAEAMRVYLAAQGIQVPDKVGKGRVGNSNFTVKDPDGHTVEFVQYEPDSMTSRGRGKFMPASRISTHMPHVGILVGALDPAMKFYRDVLGFQETWRGSSNPKQLNWVNMKVPDGNDYIEFMLYDKLPAPTRRGSAHHICLAVPDMSKAAAELEARPARKGYARAMEIRTGTNRKRQMNLFDPDGTRSELMEPNTVDGAPVPSSTAPPPR